MIKSAAVLTISDKGSRGEREDTSGPALCSLLEEIGYKVVYTATIPDEFEEIERELVKCSDEIGVSLILTTGGTGFAQRDITPEATLSVIEREVRGIPEAMRAESMRITPKGCLSRSVAGIRGKSLIINLPGSKKAAIENINAVLSAISHGIEILNSQGSANCGETVEKKPIPSMEQWLKEAKQSENAEKIGMYLTHNGVVRETAREKVREGIENNKKVKSLMFSYDKDKLQQLITETKAREGIYYVRVWLNEGKLSVGEDIMYVLIGGDIRPRVMEAMDFLVGNLKSECVKETEIF